MIIDLALYLITALVWGSTWLAIHWQLGEVSPYWSITYRMAIASALLFAICLICKKNLRFTKQQHLATFAQAVLLFSTNYLLYYLGCQYVMSGLVAVTYACISIMNILLCRLFFKTPLRLPVIIGAIIGLCGLAVIFSDQFEVILHLQRGPAHLLIHGLIICLIATLLASLGNVLFVYNQRFKMPILQSNAYGIFYGALILMVIAILVHAPLSFDTQPRYWLSLLYLAIFGTIIAFGSYLQLIQRIGAERAAYAFVVLPIVALMLSSVFEGFHWTIHTFLGLAMVIIGNILVIKRNKSGDTPPAHHLD